MKLQHGSVIEVPDAPQQVVTAIENGYVRAIPLGGRADAPSQIFTDFKIVQEMLTPSQENVMLDRILNELPV
jgi:hypothetical protein